VKWSDAGKLELEVGHTIGKATPLFHKISAPAQ
jgi:hypothetical protein